MKKATMVSYRMKFYYILILALSGVPGLRAWTQILWSHPVHAGSTADFQCFSSCSPKCNYTWFIKDRKIDGDVLSLTPDGLDDSVIIKCTVLNTETGKSDSQEISVDVENRVSVRTSPHLTVPTINQSLILACQGASPGSLPGPPYLVDKVVWYKDGQRVTLDERMRLMDNNATLHFDSLLPSDGGFYRCQSTMSIYWMERAFSVGYLLSFDPWTATIEGPDTVFPTRLSKFTCLTSCTINVDCIVKWRFGPGFANEISFSEYENVVVWTPFVPWTFQSFTCVVENKAAGRVLEATKTVEVKGHPLSGSDTLMPLSGLFIIIFSLGTLLPFDF